MSLVRRKDDFVQERQSLTVALDEAMQALSALGDFWGSDENGRLFYEGAQGRKGFRAATEEIGQHVKNVENAYTRIGENLAAAGANFETAEWATVGGLARSVYEGVLATPVTRAQVA